jgi:hypothetical protein
VSGWLSALNALAKDANLSGDSAVDNVLQWLEHYCFDNGFSTIQLGLTIFSHQVATASVPLTAPDKQP